MIAFVMLKTWWHAGRPTSEIPTPTNKNLVLIQDYWLEETFTPNEINPERRPAKIRSGGGEGAFGFRGAFASGGGCPDDGRA